jgi:hypothetical protein
MAEREGLEGLASATNVAARMEKAR